MVKLPVVVPNGIELPSMSVGDEFPSTMAAVDDAGATGVTVPFTVTVPLVIVKVALLLVVAGLLLVIVRFPDTVKPEIVDTNAVVLVVEGVEDVPTASEPQVILPAPVKVVE